MMCLSLEYLLPTYLGKSITDFCGNGFTDSSSNHCAHLVSHIMNYSFGYCCGGNGSTNRANLRVHEIFAQCQEVGKWADKPSGNCLAFITYASSVEIETKAMRNRPKKHIGIFTNEYIYHYSNTQNKVVRQLPENFSKHYGSGDFTVFYGTFPARV